MCSRGNKLEPLQQYIFALTVQPRLGGRCLALRDFILISYGWIVSKLFSILAKASFMQNWYWNMSSVSFSSCFLYCASMMVFSGAFILFIIVCSDSNFLSYLLLFLDCHISYSIICVFVIVNFVIYLFVFGSFKVNRYLWWIGFMV